MKCPECQKEGRKSTVQIGSSSSTLIAYSDGYFDEDGNYVSLKNPNTYFQDYRCSNGHEWTETYKE